MHLAYEAPWGRRNRDRIGGGGKSDGHRDTTKLVKLVVKDAKGEAVSAETELRWLGGGIWRLSVRAKEKIRPKRYNVDLRKKRRKGNEPVHGNLMYYVVWWEGKMVQ